MYAKDSRTSYEAELVHQFEKNPVGLVVELDDGSQVEVSQYRDTPRGRWLRLKRRGGPWIRETDIVGIVYFTVGLKKPAFGGS